MPDEREKKKELIMNGIAVSPGIAIGEVFVLNVDEMSVPTNTISEDQVEEEIEKFREALKVIRKELKELYRKLVDDMGENHARIVDTHIMIVDDDSMIEQTEEYIRKEKVNAALAVENTFDKTLRSFEKMQDTYLSERAEDIRDVKGRITRKLLGQEQTGLKNLEHKAVVVGRNLTPSDTLGFDRRHVQAFVSDIGGATSHAAIMARSHGIPAVVGLQEFSRRVMPHDRIIVDGTTGQVILHPEDSTIRLFEDARDKFREMEKELLTLKDYPAVTLDGRTFGLSGNVETLDEIKDVDSHGASGIGLFRTEYFFITRSSLPSEEVQYRFYREVVEKVAPDSVIFRTLDVGGDKIADWMTGVEESNPFMGWRGIRFSLSRKDIFRSQLRALFRASAHGKVRIMFPMISVMEEVLESKQICEEVKEDLLRERYVIDEDIEIGIMIETPSAVALASRLGKEVDFFSIGSNDLVQYALAVDRGNSRISYLYDPLHPSIIRLIRDTVKAARHRGIWVGLCGEMAVSEGALGVLPLIGIGLDEISAPSYLIPEIKKIIRSVTYDETHSLIRNILSKSTAGE
ncbi:MAG: phosphoenolpyruvate--protein phosphotransferase, partial [Candidatus Latescibacteria bacterium]|nr:phosphoenolpyruvate--protein phosphotransferase [bacterium]MBD3425005.1 phosphoenolpyruvate--protein phosphotransferase [Candidatus Latescibacterota bacterium]